MNTENDALGNRMKGYEGIFDNKTMPLLPVIARLDGKCFHTFTKGLARPYDVRLSVIMSCLTELLVEDTNALVGYTQSDEITLIWYSDNTNSQIYFDGRVSKINSILPAKASILFNDLIKYNIPEKASQMALFDCRVWYVPNKTEAVNTLVWRELDATKNAISMAAQSYFSPKELLGKNGSQKQEMIYSKGFNFNDYPTFFKRGVYFAKRIKEKKFTIAELDKLPAKHEARTNPDLVVKRSVVEKLDLPPITKIVNREAVFFDGAEPIGIDNTKKYSKID